MNSLQIEFLHLVDGKEVAESFESITVDPTSPEEWQLPPDDLKRKMAEQWITVEIPNGETIDVCVTISVKNDGFSVLMKQNGVAVFQLGCMGKPFFSFRTFRGELVTVQAHDCHEYVQSA